ncbi:ATP:cob(I)alamin adenosyltransferase [Candidatus Woesearchaeota archaeon CG10_big_fil_rev_8_21_14_0_10_45_16]|nr:MAG: ATP:cob(I)alamin adenosyltransferase [Candidatus Woesearchaeota archaeon CG10_big_fil_rev_8_21_14_0_10_45_16]
MKIYTKIGDAGKTTFFGCGLVSKDDPRIEAFGALDELNSVLGLTISFTDDKVLISILTKIQNDLFQLGADLVGSKLSAHSMPRITKEHVEELERKIDELEEKLGMPDSFILPGGTKESAFLHLSRVITRRAERTLVKVQNILELNPEMLKYINRLSDFMYVLARQSNKELDVKEQQPIYKYLGD